jgi:type II secretory pathway pseudopilin PulG
MRTRHFSNGGFSLAEVTIMLMVLSVMSAVISPAIGDYVTDARHVKAAGDVQVLAVSFSRFAFDARDVVPGHREWQQYDVLVGQGQAPELGQGGEAAWVGDVGQPAVGRLDDHLMTNVAGYETSTGQGAALWVRGWRGPYLAAGIGPDPRGHRYAIDVGGWSRRGADVVVLSAGPNGLIETPFLRDGTVPHGDDIVVVFSPGN